MTPESVENIHKLGGSILVSDRGNPPHSEIAKALGESLRCMSTCGFIQGDVLFSCVQVMQRRKVRQFFVLGGASDGLATTFHGSKGLFETRLHLFLN